MVLQMARPTKNAKTGVYYFRQKTPADLVAVVGKKEVGWSLGTKDPEQAKVLNTLAVQKQAMIWERYRKRPEPLPHAKIVALSGILYRDYMAMLELEPGEPTIWQQVLALLDRAAATPDRKEQWYGEEADTGARVTEIAQLRKEDLVTEHGVLCLRITPDAGSVKTGNYRLAPVHPQLLEQGLLEMVRGLPDGPIFYSAGIVRGKAADPVERAQSAGAKVGQWVRDFVGLTDPNVQPNHAWRHRFKTAARDSKMDLEVRDAIQGHEDGRAASDYGEVSVKAMWDAIQRLPRFDLQDTAPMEQ